MKNVQEVSHIKNIAAFERLIAYCNSYGAKYNPSAEALKIANLETKLSKSKKANEDSDDIDVVKDNSTNSRVILFKDLPQFCTRIVNALDATPASAEVVLDARHYQKLLQGKRITPLPEKPAAAAGTATEEKSRTREISQKSFDKKLEHFRRLITIVSLEPHYKPNEEDITVPALNKKYDTLEMANTIVINAEVEQKNLEIRRDDEMYEKPDGLVPVALDAKLYIKSIFGANSPEFKQVNALRFRNLRRK